MGEPAIRRLSPIALVAIAMGVFGACKDEPLDGLPDGFAVPDLVGREITKRSEADARHTLVIAYPQTDRAKLHHQLSRGLRDAGWKSRDGRAVRGGNRWTAVRGDLAVEVDVRDSSRSGAEIVLIWRAGSSGEAPSAHAGAAAPSGPTAAATRFVRELTTGCDNDDARSCWLAGAALTRGAGGLNVDAARAGALFARGCAPPKRLAGCPDHYRVGSATIGDAEASVLGAACARGRRDACAVLLAGDKRPSEATRRAACGAGLIERCLELGKPVGGALASSVRESRRLPPGAAALAREAAGRCDRQAGYACATLALGYLEGNHGLPRDRARAAAIGRRACSPSHAWGCFVAAAATFAGAAAPEQIAESIRLAELGCDRHQPESCGFLAEVLLKDGRPELWLRARRLALVACHLGDSDSCAALDRSLR